MVLIRKKPRNLITWSREVYLNYYAEFTKPFHTSLHQKFSTRKTNGNVRGVASMFVLGNK
jgi:hypothetical protein